MTTPADTEHPPIVGIGGGSGSMRALESPISGVFCDPALSVVLALHDDGAGDLEALLASLPHERVHHAPDGLEPTAGHVYVRPTHHELTLRDGRFLVVPPGSVEGFRCPIDMLFRCLA